MTEQIPTQSDQITVTIDRVDALAMMLGPLDYAIEVGAGRAPMGGSPLRVRTRIADALREQTRRADTDA